MVWLAVVIFTVMLAFFIRALANWNDQVSGLFLGVSIFSGVFLAVILILIYAVWPLLRWLFWKHWRRTLFGLACFATLVALFYAEENWRGKHDWEKFQKEWAAKGEHFDFASVVPPAVPDEQNFAMAPIIVESIEAAGGSNVTRQWYGKTLTDQERSNLVDRLNISLVNNYTDWPTNGGGSWQKSRLTRLEPMQNYYRTLAARTNLFPVSPRPQTPAQDVLLALSKYDSALEELRQASLRPAAQFPVYSNPDRPFDMLLPHLSLLKRCGQFLQLRAIAELQNNQSQAALDDVKLSLRLTESLRGEPFLICHLVRIAILNLALQPIYEGLAEHQWSDAQLAELDAELAKLDLLADYQQSMRGERACQVGMIEFLRSAHDRPRAYSNLFVDSENMSMNNAMVLLINFAPSGWFYLNELAVARMNQEFLLPLADVQNRIVSPEAVSRASSAETDFVSKSPRVAFIARMIYPALGGAVRKSAFAQEAVDLARVAIALERCRLAHGDYPDSLDSLAPQFIEKIPHDIINGQPLHYRRTSDGQFVLYSVGWNETDDGGVVVLDKKTGPVRQNEGDWVWRYPQKE